MNDAYFFIPFILVMSLGLGQELVIDAYSTGATEKGFNYDRTFLYTDQDGLNHYSWTSTPERIQSNSQYFDYIFTDTGNALIVETMQGSITLDKTTCGFSFHNKGLISQNPMPLFSDSLVPFSKTVNLDNWSVVTQVDEAPCSASWNGTELTATKNSPGIGTVSYKYILNGHTWKTELEATNLTGLINKVFGFDQTISLNRDVVFFAGNQRNLDNYDGVTFDRTFLENNQGDVINFLNGYNFNLDIGFEYLDSITISDSGIDSSQITFHYMRNNKVLSPNETLVIDPTFGPSSGTIVTIVDTGCVGTASSSNANGYVGANSGPTLCNRSAYYWDITTIPDSAIIDDVIWTYDTTEIYSASTVCIVNSIEGNVSTMTDQQILDDIDDGTNFGSFTTGCRTVANDYTFTVSTMAADLQAELGVDNEWALGVYGQNYINLQLARLIAPELTVLYTDVPVIDAVDDLILVSESFGTVIISWSQPDLNGGNLTGYQINYTTPYGSPLTTITNNTSSTDTSATITGLGVGTQYTFGVSGWTEGGVNATHPPMSWLNVTTGGNFTIGTAVFNQTNSEVLPITFETQSVNDTAIFLNVTFSNAFDLACNFDYKFAMINQTYKDLDSYAVSTTLNETVFLFNNVTNEVIGIDCWDYNTGTDADTVLTISDFPLLNQIESFRNGEFGTMGKIGVFDIVTLFVVIISMIGLNRVNESVGIVFNIALLGSLAYFGIIELPTILFGVLALVMVFVITSTRKG